MSNPVIPAVLYAEHKLPSGEVVSIALVRTRWSQEGQAVIERTDTENTMDLIEQTAWYVRGGDEGPATLHIDRSARIDEELSDEVLALLLAQLHDLGASWGIEAVEPVGVLS